MQGFKKSVAIKRVLPHLAQNAKFIQMFLDEARLSAKLNHANIVTVFDIGTADDTYFIVMEFVDGANLKKIIEGVRKQRGLFPLKEALYICMEACRGLSYAHELVGDHGEALHIVHRDISPPNIMITKRGEVKVADFGLAKASTQIEKTDPGVVKGKFSYLAPEAASGSDVDARADIFSLAIVLWEMLAGRRLFLGENDYATVKLVQQANIPRLSPLNREVDEAFEEVLFKALARKPADRYQSAREFGDALAGYLFGRQLKVTSYDIATLVQAAINQPENQARGDQSIIDRLIQEELVHFTSLDEKEDAPARDSNSGERDITGSQPLDVGSFENPADWFSGDSEAPTAPKSSKGLDDGWRESGVAAAPSPSVASARKSVPPAARAQLKEPAAVTAERSVAPTDTAGVQGEAIVAPAVKSGGAGIKIAITLFVVAAAVAAAWFGQLIPH
jgi:serine/threonine-protein kinase